MKQQPHHIRGSLHRKLSCKCSSSQRTQILFPQSPTSSPWLTCDASTSGLRGTGMPPKAPKAPETTKASKAAQGVLRQLHLRFKHIYQSTVIWLKISPNLLPCNRIETTTAPQTCNKTKITPCSPLELHPFPSLFSIPFLPNLPQAVRPPDCASKAASRPTSCCRPPCVSRPRSRQAFLKSSKGKAWRRRWAKPPAAGSQGHHKKNRRQQRRSQKSGGLKQVEKKKLKPQECGLAVIQKASQEVSIYKQITQNQVKNSPDPSKTFNTIDNPPHKPIKQPSKSAQKS